MTVGEVYQKIDELAPFVLQESYDNAGLLVGDAAREVTGIHVALDVTEAVLDEAASLGANLLVTHHPLMFSPIRRITADDYESRLLARLIRGRMSLIAAHTNLDRAPHGVSQVLAETCGLEGITGDGFLRVGELPVPMTAGVLAGHVSAALGDTVRVMGQSEKEIRRVAVVSGAGSDFWQEALQAGAEALITGEVKHHLALAAADAGLVLLEAGHFATEQPGIFALGDTLQNWLDKVQCTMRVSKSRAGAYALPREMPRD